MLTSSRISTRSILASMTKKFSSAAFDVLAVGGKDLRKLPLSMRKMNLEQLLARRPEGVFINPFERGGLRWRPATTITGGTQEECPFLAVFPPGSLA